MPETPYGPPKKGKKDYQESGGFFLRGSGFNIGREAAEQLLLPDRFF